MKKLIFLTLIVLAAAAILSACGGERKPENKQPQGQTIPPMGKPVVEVPAAVKGKWKAVVLVVENKETKQTKDETIAIGEKYKIPDSDLTVQVTDFFPAFVMQGSTITSTSNETTNPAAQVVVEEGGSEVFRGWLFARFPTTHAFSHPKYAITLKEGLPK